MFEWIERLTLFETVLFITGIVILNLLYMYVVKAYMEKYYARTMSPELALNRLRILSQYIYLIVVCISSFFTAILFMIRLVPYLHHLADPLHTLIALISTFTFIGILLTINQLILMGITKKIRQTEETIKEEIVSSVKGLAFVFVPIMVFFTLIELLPEGFVGEMAFVPIATLLLVFIPLVSSLFIGKLLKAHIMPESEIKDQLRNFIKEKTDLPDVKLYIWPTKKTKVANALVSGFGNVKEIYLTDYMLENMKIKEIEAILAHEIGHIKKHHLWKRIAYIAILPLGGYLLGNGFDWFEENVMTIPVWLGLTVMIGLIIIYLVLVLNLIYRKHEREADEYVLKLGVDYRDFAAGLLKLSELNQMVTKMNKVDESFQTHPSTARRVQWIIEKAGGTMEDFAEYRKERVEELKESN
ncbi:MULTISPECIES: M48 family metalloprotease [Bacillaceae]|uniref:M48 family metalloprotease n=1 Tax=Evansella alkalicola TaxID=745819 RepID=A0ABS6JQU2_9BACI|nr:MULTISPECIES: M48 family metalloprotease [Bacillaceae]MBU9720905.1 M48 family metalloprotease [Bacillus alkalicola]